MLLIPLAILDIDDVVDVIGQDTDILSVVSEAVSGLVYGHYEVAAGIPAIVDARDFNVVSVDHNYNLVIGITDTHAHAYFNGTYTDAVTWVLS